MSLSKRLLKIRVDNGLTQKQMAEIMGVTERGYRKFESGENDPNIKYVLAVADHFSVSLDYLTCRSDDPKPPK